MLIKQGEQPLQLYRTGAISLPPSPDVLASSVPSADTSHTRIRWKAMSPLGRIGPAGWQAPGEDQVLQLHQKSAAPKQRTSPANPHERPRKECPVEAGQWE